MPIEILTPSSRDEWLALRRETIGASESPALLGVHPWTTAYALHCLKAGLRPGDHDETPAMRRGRLLEDDALTILQEERPDWRITPNPMPGGKFFRNMDLRMSCTPDAFVEAPSRGRGVCQVKSVQSYVFNRQWKVDGAIEPPLHVAVQALQEARLTGADWACVVALVVDYGIDAHVIDIPLHAGLIDRIEAEVAAFWRSIELKQPPDPDLYRDAELIDELYVPGSYTIDLAGDNLAVSLVAEREQLSKASSAAKKRNREIKSELLLKLNGAGAAKLADGRILKAKRVMRAGYTVKETDFIDLRITKGSDSHGVA